MTIFQLLIYSCLATHGLDGELLSQTCRWDARDLYRERDKCERDGSAEIGRPIHEFNVVLGAGPRKAERHKCTPVAVR